MKQFADIDLSQFFNSSMEYALPHVMAHLTRDAASVVQKIGMSGYVHAAREVAEPAFNELLKNLVGVVACAYDGPDMEGATNSGISPVRHLVFYNDYSYAHGWMAAYSTYCHVQFYFVSTKAEHFSKLETAMKTWFKEFTKVNYPVVHDVNTAIKMLVRTARGIEAHPITLKKKEFIKENYSGEVQRAFVDMSATLCSDSPRGRLIILEGPPGTGKTHIMRALVAACVEKCNFYVINAPTIALVASPEYLSSLIQIIQQTPGKAHVFILEDAEKALAPRKVVHEGGDGPDADQGAINALLNMTDGIYGEGLNLRVLATTNAAGSSLDTALMRKGRLAHHVKVGYLSASESVDCFHLHTGKLKDYHGPRPLSDIYDDIADVTSASLVPA